MNFFAAQDSARRSTSILVILFILAVLGMVVLTNLLVIGVLSAEQLQSGSQSATRAVAENFSWDLAIPVSIGVLLLVGGGTVYKMLMLSHGGSAVAEMLGGQLISQDSRDPDHRKVLNVVEEMAIAAGVPVPPVYVLEEEGINAFAAGNKISNAVIGVTHGTIHYLSREELQGVIAHEFSHILNGDMKLNIRLTGVLHGILIIGLTGYYLLRSMRYSRSRSRDGKSAGGILVLGLGLVVIGFVGVFFGNLIKAMVSRQREYLADASAVQFTRNPGGISGALKKIGGLVSGSQIESPAASEYSHAYFAKGVKSLFATHPPLDERIRRIDPAWDGQFPVVTETGDEQQATAAMADAEFGEQRPEQARQAAAILTGVAIADAMSAVDNVGNPGQQHLQYAQHLMQQVPAGIMDEVRDAYGARAVIYSLLLDTGNESVAKKQWQILEDLAEPPVYDKTGSLHDSISGLGREYFLPLIELASASLRQMSKQQFEAWRVVVNSLIKADSKVDYREWIIQRLVLRPLEERHGFHKPRAARYKSLQALADEVATLLSLAATIEHTGQGQDLVVRAFREGAAFANLSNINLKADTDLSLDAVNQALDRLDQLKPLVKPQLLKAVAACIAWDNEVSSEGMELLRAISANLDCPMPPIIDYLAE
jgi:Zn-dependent protease with chaperone function